MDEIGAFTAHPGAAAAADAGPHGTASQNNPLLNIGFNIPFEALLPAHVEPAVAALLEQSRRNIEAIENDPAPPTYDNTLFVEGISERKYKELRDDIRGPLYDKTYMQKYPPGSVIKPFMAMTGLREQVISADTQFVCAGGIKVPYDFDESKGNVYGCWAKAGQGTKTPVTRVTTPSRTIDGLKQTEPVAPL